AGARPRQEAQRDAGHDPRLCPRLPRGLRPDHRPRAAGGAPRPALSVMSELFHRIAKAGSTVLGAARAVIGALVIVIAWAASGPLFHFSDTWQLVINTGTTIVTFLMVFLIQNTQNRNSKALHLKLDELLCAVKEARTGLVGLEHLSDSD